VALDDTTPVPAGWLALREPADEDARARATPALLEHLGAPPTASRGGGAPLTVVDLGAGTGANLRHLAPLLRRAGAGPQRWTLLDHDADLLARTSSGPLPAGVEAATPRLGDLAELRPLLVDAPAGLVTCAALLDLLLPGQVEALAQAVVGARAPALFALTVTGGVELDPPHPADAALRRAFDDHQQRGGRLGPRAAGAAVQALAEAGARVLAVPTPWHLGPDRPDLLGSWLEGRAGAAVEQDPGLATTAAGWLEERTGQVAAGALRAVVHHVDLAALPA
jgi:hypothetical protein